MRSYLGACMMVTLANLKSVTIREFEQMDFG